MSLFAGIEASQQRYGQGLCSPGLRSLDYGGEQDEENYLPSPSGTEYQTSHGQGASQRRQVLGHSNHSSFSGLPSMSQPSAGSAYDFRTLTQGQFSGEGPSFGPDMTHGGSSVLGRRKRSETFQEWSPPTKARLRTYADNIGVEYGVPDEQRQEFLGASVLPTHKLLIVTLAAVLGQQGQPSGGESRLQVYLASSDFKENVVNQIRGVLLDPKVPSYKTGFLDRLMRHIRLNPGMYHIPQELRAMITTRLFTSKVSSAATTARAEIKRKMTSAWKAQTNIYDLVKSLAWKSSQEMTDDIWGRLAWVQMKLVDYGATTGGKGGKDDGPWDFVDKELAEQREKALAIPVATRAAYSSFIFEESLKTHLSLCKPKAKKKSSTRVSKWQEDISRAVAEMESYTQEDLAEEDLEEEEEGGADVDPSPAPEA